VPSIRVAPSKLGRWVSRAPRPPRPPPSLVGLFCNHTTHPTTTAATRLDSAPRTTYRTMMPPLTTRLPHSIAGVCARRPERTRAAAPRPRARREKRTTNTGLSIRQATHGAFPLAASRDRRERQVCQAGEPALGGGRKPWGTREAQGRRRGRAAGRALGSRRRARKSARSLSSDVALSGRTYHPPSAHTRGCISRVCVCTSKVRRDVGTDA